MERATLGTLSSTADDKTITPAAVETSIHLAVTATVTLFVGILFFVVYLQLIMVIYYGYRLVSYQTLLLFDILLWAALRLTLYSFYFFHCCALVDRLSPFFTWLLVAFPSALQFTALAILVHYFGEVRHKIRTFELCASLISCVFMYMYMYGTCTTCTYTCRLDEVICRCLLVLLLVRYMPIALSTVVLTCSTSNEKSFELK